MLGSLANILENLREGNLTVVFESNIVRPVIPGVEDEVKDILVVPIGAIMGDARMVHWEIVQENVVTRIVVLVFIFLRRPNV